MVALALFLAALGADSVAQAAGASIHVYDLLTGRQVKSLAGHNRPTTAIAVSPDGTLALTASLTPELRLWSLQTGREIRSIDQAQLPGYVGPGSSVQFVNGTNQALIARMQAGVHLWSLTENALLLSFQAPFQGASAAVVSPHQKTVLAIGGSELQVALWGLPKGEPLGVFTEEWMMEPRYVSLARDGKARSWWNAESGEPWPEGRSAPTGTRTESDPSDHAILAPNGRLLVTYGPSGAQRNVYRLHVWDLESGKLVWHRRAWELPLVYTFIPTATCAAIGFSPDSRRLAIARQAGGVEVQEIGGSTLAKALQCPAGAADRLAFLPDGRQLLTWGEKTMQIWDLGGGQLVRAFPVPVVNCLTVTPDGRFLLVGGDGEFRGL